MGQQEASISVVTASELLVGVCRANTPEIRQLRSQFVEGILARFPILEIDLSVGRNHAELQAELTVQGAMIGRNDLWIAATAKFYGHSVLTTNAADFVRINGLNVIEFDRK